ncbi:UDP-N-acetylglucosamine--N-acetylmuramyl-(pentapeptide) pyrophosphoryl-undecaprenol N-acetylglucosamine transferase [Candidatus Gottesmanbacteria bacterium]|nr:UDP-N-acetylglucosamine--N-acetylmuramyl-(pentapeptide) pyrophosphoryl-undecaprenol N-acetylglucosamine transferase [Candidatus Gottesmanbacteria bacterium]
MKQYRKICITGGHPTPAIAVAETLKSLHPDWKIVWIGRNIALDDSSIPAEEESLVRQQNIRFLGIRAGRSSHPLQIFLGFFQAFGHCLREKPDCIVSFGGYVALPVAAAGWLLQIPIITHEQTHGAGLTNRIIAGMARRICVSFRESMRYFPVKKTILTGLPLRRKLFQPVKKSQLNLDGHMPMLYITGGSTGAVSLNKILFPLIFALVDHWCIVHQTGRVSYEDAIRVKESLGAEKKGRYIVQKFIALDELAWLYAHARIVIARAGANTVGELAALGKVSVLLPLPWSSDQEQQANARWLESSGSAVVLSQQTTTPALLAKALHLVDVNFEIYKRHADQMRALMTHDASVLVAAEIALILEHVRKSPH